MKFNLAAALGTTLVLSLAVPAAQADSLSGVENSRAKERAGRYLDRQDREHLRRYGGNGYPYRYGYRDYGYGYYDEPGVSVYVGPGGVGVYGY